MDEEQARIRSYLVAQGAKLTPAALVDKVRSAMADLRAAAVAVPAARFGERPEPEEWSGNEVMAHVLAADGYFAGGIRDAPAGRSRTRRSGPRRPGAPRSTVHGRRSSPTSSPPIPRQPLTGASTTRCSG